MPETSPSPFPIDHFTTTQHGRVLIDEFDWLRHLKGPAAVAYLEREDAYTSAVLGRLDGFTRTLAAEAASRGELDRSDRDDALIEAAGCARAPHARIGEVSSSDDGRYVAFTLDTVGRERYALYVQDLETGTFVVEGTSQASSLAWTTGPILYLVEVGEAPFGGRRLLRLDVAHRRAELAFAEGVLRLTVGVRRSSGGGFVIMDLLDSASAAPRRFAHACRAVDASEDSDWTTWIDRDAGIGCFVDEFEGVVFAQLDDLPGGRLVRGGVGDPLTAMDEIYRAPAGSTIESFVPMASACVVRSWKDASLVVTLVPLNGSSPYPVTILEGPSVHAVTEVSARSFSVEASSPGQPPRSAQHDLGTRRTTIKDEARIEGFDPGRYETWTLHAVADDGVAIPITVVGPRDRTGEPRAVLTGYGCYGVGSEPAFRREHVSLLARGVSVAIAHIRGGGEGGRPWHDMGRASSKPVTWSDFISCAEALIERRLATPDRLVIVGGSAGGTLVLTAAYARPDLFAGVVADVPFADPLHAQLDDRMPWTVFERAEWGDPAGDAAAFDLLATYCPYTTIRAQEYPPMYLTTARYDGEVPWWQPARYVARLRRTKVDPHPVTLRVNLHAGHQGASDPAQARAEQAEMLAFVLDRLGLTEGAPGTIEPGATPR